MAVCWLILTAVRKEMCDGARMMLRALYEGSVEDGKRFVVGYLLGVKKGFLAGAVRWELSDVRRVDRGSHVRPLVMQREHDGSYHRPLSPRTSVKNLSDSRLCHIVSLLSHRQHMQLLF